MLLNDTKDFLKSEKVRDIDLLSAKLLTSVQWYADRGIPFQRGYLLHGVPGSGKSSLIHAIAGELMLDIYTLSLSSSWISDGTLTTLMSRVPARCIVLLEDLDAAFTRSVTRDSDSTGTPGGDKNKDRHEEGMDPMAPPSSSRSRRNREVNLSDVNTLSLSGLLNALDGVTTSEGRILFATTNHERLDPALSRPGRMDVWVEFRNASKWQAEALFRNFFPSTEEESAVKDAEMDKELCGIDLPTTPMPQLPSSVDLSSVSPSFRHSPALAIRPWPCLARRCLARRLVYMPLPVEENIASLAHSVAFLAEKFPDGCPDEEFSVAALQGCKYLCLRLTLSASGY
ncbi:P-loop containing nucleoside triphosphate hydrolase protein [Athelia psychrophila]|uniref:P-loop containing nucleoside triphosphate hydrolase protein n=1 Tax=Athelia psychrophila TaxID=1759441 RepID=A0A166TWA7_9AGAM|nr:P-loop containing nucleoside triphosphate hydrolase protein [Fibularhizoctonia sp. CBS 109695]